MAMLPGCASPRLNADVLAQDAAWVDDTIAVLDRQGDPDSLVAIALLSESPLLPLDRLDSAAIEALRRAALSAPDNAVIAALRLFACLTAKECDETEPAAALQRLDPGNAAALVPRVRSALRSGDADAIDAAVAEFAGATTFNLHQNPGIVSAIDALGRATLPRRPGSDEFVDVRYLTAEMLGAYSTYALSLFESSGTVTEICRDAVLGSARHSNCVRAFKLMMSADTSILQILGASLTCRIAPADSAQVATAREFMRRFEWTGILRSEAMGPIPPSEGDSSAIRRFLIQDHEAMRLHAREDDARRAHLISLGMDPDPPEDWMPKKESAIGNAMSKCGVR
jgi:hypothetical protein